MKELIGKRIEAVFVGPDQYDMVFVTDAGILKYEVEGDCCSTSWFSDIYNFDALLGIVTSAEDLAMPDYNVDDGRGRQEEDSVYGHLLKTDKGAATIVFRNSSNGYYGGWLHSAEAINSVPDGWTAITEDWKA